MTHWHTKDSHNESILADRFSADRRLCPRKNRLQRATGKPKRYSYCSPCGYPNPSTAHPRQEAYNAPCASNTDDTGGKSGVVGVSVCSAVKSAIGKDGISMGKCKVQGGSLSNMRRLNQCLFWANADGLAGNTKAIPVGDRVYESGRIR